MSTTAPTPTAGASFHRGKSRQDFPTPQDFRDAVVGRFGFPQFDLAADALNCFSVTGSHFNEAQNSLSRNWSTLPHDLVWLNPPFSDIAPWAKKCAENRGDLVILFLTPAAIGSNWFQDFVWPNAKVFALNPRMSFDGKNPYPKDCVLSAFGLGEREFLPWRWKP
jgi:hypothetical protein